MVVNKNRVEHEFNLQKKGSQYIEKLKSKTGEKVRSVYATHIHSTKPEKKEEPKLNQLHKELTNTSDGEESSQNSENVENLENSGISKRGIKRYCCAHEQSLWIPPLSPLLFPLPPPGKLLIKPYQKVKKGEPLFKNTKNYLLLHGSTSGMISNLQEVPV